VSAVVLTMGGTPATARRAREASPVVEDPDPMRARAAS
jgi:hypothetical protein